MRPQSASESVVSVVHLRSGARCAIHRAVISSGWMYPVLAPKSITMLQSTSRSAIGMRVDQRAGKFDAEIGRGVLAIELRDAQRDVLGVDPRSKLAVQIEAEDFRHFQPVVAEREIGSDVGVSHAGGDAAERAVGDGVGISAEDQRARKGVALFRKDDMTNSLTGVEFGDALLFDPFAGLLLRHRVLLADRRIVMIEHHDDPRRIENLARRPSGTTDRRRGRRRDR